MVNITAFFDASHAANKVTRRSHTGFVIFFNREQIICYSKRQNNVKASNFSSEFITLKVCMEYIVALRYKLQMFGVDIKGPANILGENLSVVRNGSKIKSSLDKKHNSLAYHSCRWAVAAIKMRFGWVNTQHNVADALTKRLTVVKRNQLFGDCK